MDGGGSGVGGSSTAAGPAGTRQLKRQASGESYALPGKVRTCVYQEATRDRPAGSASAAPAGPTQTAPLLSVGHLRCLYLFAFWSQFKPSEPFLVDYLLDAKGLPAHEVYQNVFDLFIYARLPCVALVGLFSAQPWGDSRRILVGGAAGGLATVLLTRFGPTLIFQQSAQFTVAAAFASRVACPAVAFAIAHPSQYQASVHTLKAVMLFSNFCSAAVGEALRDYAGVPLTVLFDASAVGQALSLWFALMLPRAQEPDSPGSTMSLSSEEDAREEPGGAEQGDCMVFFKQLVADLQSSLQLRSVQWWTAWALWMNPVHGLAMTYWQGLVRQKQILSDHNGTLLASMYLIAAFFTLVSGSSSTLRRLPSLLIIVSMFGAGALLLQVVAASKELPVYGWLLLYQCLFEVMTAIATFQVGAEVTQRLGAAGASKGGGGGSPARRFTWTGGGAAGRLAGNKQASSPTDRLTALFSATAIASSANENLILGVVNRWPSMHVRFHCLAVCLEVCAVALLAARGAEALWSWHGAAAERSNHNKPSGDEPNGVESGKRVGASEPLLNPRCNGAAT